MIFTQRTIIVNLLHCGEELLLRWSANLENSLPCDTKYIWNIINFPPIVGQQMYQNLIRLKGTEEREACDSVELTCIIIHQQWQQQSTNLFVGFRYWWPRPQHIMHALGKYIWTLKSCPKQTSLAGIIINITEGLSTTALSCLEGHRHLQRLLLPLLHLLVHHNVIGSTYKLTSWSRN